MSPQPTFPVIVCRHGEYTSASNGFAAVRDNESDVHGALLTTLTGLGGMGGSDPAGTTWAKAYDTAVGSALEASSKMVSACGRTRDLLAASAFNHAAGEAAATLPPTSPPAAPQLGYDPCLATYSPSAVGAGGGTMPKGWSLLTKFVDIMWPDGDSGLLRAAKTVWHSAADSLTNGASPISNVVSLLGNQQSPEIPRAIDTCSEMGVDLTALAATYRAIGDSCGEYAQHLDEAHHKLLIELGKMLLETAALEMVIQITAPETVGLSEAANVGVATRIAVYGRRISGIVAELLARAGRVATDISLHISTKVTPMLARIGRWLDEAVPKLWGTDGATGVQLFSRSASRTNMDVLENGGKVPFTKEAIVALAQRAGIDLSGVDIKIADTTEEARYYDYWKACGQTPSELGGKQITFAPSAFMDDETMVATIAHEMKHVEQLKAQVQLGTGTLDGLEDEAYAAEIPALAKFRGEG